MSYVFPKGPNSRLEIHKVAVSTPEDKIQKDSSDYNYEVTLDYAITNVIGISLVEWSFPRDVIPSFYPDTTKLDGNNTIDFELFNPDIAAAPQLFTSYFPTRFLNYQSPGKPQDDYSTVVGQIINREIAKNATWKDKVVVTCVPQSLLGTFLVCSTIDLTLPATTTTQLKLLFASGPNTRTNASGPMGFDVADYTSSQTLVYLYNGSQAIESPNTTNLRAANYVDVTVTESNLKPLQRIFVRDDTYTTNIFSTEGINRLSIDTDNPPRRIDKLHIQLRYENFDDPGDFTDAPILIPHAMTFHIISLVDENHANPSYVNQNLTY